MMWGFGLFGIYFFTSLYLQNVLGFSPTKAGLAFLPMALLMAAGAVVSEQITQRLGAPGWSAFAMVLMAAGIASVSLLSADASFLDLMPGFAVIGIGGGLTVPLTASVLDAMPREEAGVASGIFNAAREVSGLLGITVIGAILAARQSGLLAADRRRWTRFSAGTGSASWSPPGWCSPARWPPTSGCGRRAARVRMPAEADDSSRSPAGPDRSRAHQAGGNAGLVVCARPGCPPSRGRSDRSGSAAPSTAAPARSTGCRPTATALSRKASR